MDEEFLEDVLSSACNGLRLMCSSCRVFRAVPPSAIAHVMQSMDDSLPFCCGSVARTCFHADSAKQDPLKAAFHRLCSR